MAKIKIFTIAGLLFLNTFLKAQPELESTIFSNTHGLVGDNMSSFEVEGYSIYMQDFDEHTFNEDGIRAVRRKSNINPRSTEYTDSLLNFNHKVFTFSSHITENLVKTTSYYFVPTHHNKVRIIGFSVSPSRDFELERIFVNALKDNKVPKTVYSGPGIDSVQFVGRYLLLGGACHWMSPHNVQCPDFGQISWSEFRSLQRAKEVLDAQYEITANKGLGKFLKRDTVQVVFEGKEIQAIKAVYKIKIPKFVMGGSNILIIYYISTELRGKYISCIMSHYIDDINATYLAPLLNEVMELK